MASSFWMTKTFLRLAIYLPIICAYTSQSIPSLEGSLNDSCAKPRRATENLLLQLHHHTVKKEPADQQSVFSSSFLPPEGSIVARHGQLKVLGTKVVNEHNEPVRLRGMSLFWSQWMPQFWKASTIGWLKEDWQISFVRAAMGIEMGGYLENPSAELHKLEGVVEACIREGIYVVIDWHDHNADQHLGQSSAFFNYVAEKYGHFPNVLFETFNEPMAQDWSNTIKPYHEQILQTIRTHSQNIVILGTRFWSQNVDEAAEDPVVGSNIAYTIHFYANSHRQELRDKVQKALDLGVAIFATEWGTCDATGDGSLDLGETQKWLQFFEENNISDANWAVDDKSEACAALMTGASADGQWHECQLTRSGSFVRASLRGEASSFDWSPCTTTATTTTTLTTTIVDLPLGLVCSDSNLDCRQTGCCNDRHLRCYVKNEWWAGCRPSCDKTSSENLNSDIQDWSCEEVLPVLPEGSNVTISSSQRSASLEHYRSLKKDLLNKYVTNT